MNYSMTDHSPFITVIYGVTGWKAVKYEWENFAGPHPPQKGYWREMEVLPLRVTALSQWREIVRVAQQWANETGTRFVHGDYALEYEDED